MLEDGRAARALPDILQLLLPVPSRPFAIDASRAHPDLGQPVGAGHVRIKAVALEEQWADAGISEGVHVPARRGVHIEPRCEPLLPERGLVDAPEVVRAPLVRLHPAALVEAVAPAGHELAHPRLRRRVGSVEPVGEEVDLGHVEAARRVGVEALEDGLVRAVAEHVADVGVGDDETRVLVRVREYEDLDGPRERLRGRARVGCGGEECRRSGQPFRCHFGAG